VLGGSLEYKNPPFLFYKLRQGQMNKKTKDRLGDGKINTGIEMKENYG
jgi:hypothetical protein